jgi:hypothetical protein
MVQKIGAGVDDECVGAFAGAVANFSAQKLLGDALEIDGRKREFLIALGAIHQRVIALQWLLLEFRRRVDIGGTASHGDGRDTQNGMAAGQAKGACHRIIGPGGLWPHSAAQCAVSLDHALSTMPTRTGSNIRPRS